MVSFKKQYLFIALAAGLTVLPACRKSGSNSGSGGAGASATHAGAPGVPVSGGVQKVPTEPTGSRRSVQRSRRADELFRLGQSGRADLRQVCTRGEQGRLLQAASVTHYYIPSQASVGNSHCRNGFGYYGQPSMNDTCLHPCRTMAADPRYYRPGEILFFPELVGLTCGSGKNKMVHDGFMVVTDNGNPEAINTEGRFGFFWGRCKNEQNGFCLDEGAIAIDFTLTFSNYCRAWRPQDPTWNSDIKLMIYNQVRKEAIRHGDRNASDFDLDVFIGLGVDQKGFIYRHSSP